MLFRSAASVRRGATEAPRGTGARAAGEEDEAMSRLTLTMGVSRLATISGPAAQEEARVRALRLIGQDVLITDDRQEVLQYLLDPIWFHGVPGSNPLFHVLVLRV